MFTIPQCVNVYANGSVVLLWRSIKPTKRACKNSKLVATSPKRCNSLDDKIVEANIYSFWLVSVRYDVFLFGQKNLSQNYLLFKSGGFGTARNRVSTQKWHSEVFYVTTFKTRGSNRSILVNVGTHQFLLYDQRLFDLLYFAPLRYPKNFQFQLSLKSMSNKKKLLSQNNE